MAVVLVSFVCLSIVWWFLLGPGRKPRKASRRSRPSPPRNPYRATSIAHGSSACPAARAVEDDRFLPGEAPRLPLSGCNSGKCHCRYVFHEDRRTPDERRTFFGLAENHFATVGRTERRAARGRRTLDATRGKADAHFYDDLDLGAG